MSLSPVSVASHFVASYAESQLGADPTGANRLYDCVPASVALTLQAFGFPYIHPQALQDLVYWPGRVGGSDFGYYIKRLAELGRWPNLPPMTLTDTSNGDTVAFVHDALAKGFAVILDFKDDTNAQLVPVWHVGWHGTHASVAVACDDSTISIINVWTGVIQTFSHAIFNQATTAPAGNVWTWERDLNAHSAGGIDDVLVIVDMPAPDSKAYVCNPPFKQWAGPAQVRALEALGVKHLTGAQVNDDLQYMVRQCWQLPSDPAGMLNIAHEESVVAVLSALKNLPGGSVDLKPVLDAIKGLTLHAS